jgi:hypothetical protein
MIGAGFDRDDLAGRDVDAHVVSPAVRQQGLFRKDRRHFRASPSDADRICIYIIGATAKGAKRYRHARPRDPQTKKAAPPVPPFRNSQWGKPIPQLPP